MNNRELRNIRRSLTMLVPAEDLHVLMIFLSTDPDEYAPGYESPLTDDELECVTWYAINTPHIFEFTERTRANRDALLSEVCA